MHALSVSKTCSAGLILSAFLGEPPCKFHIDIGLIHKRPLSVRGRGGFENWRSSGIGGEVLLSSQDV